MKKEEGVIIAAAPFLFLHLLACFLFGDQTVKPETPMSMYMPMSMNTFLHCLRSVSYSRI